MKILTFPDPFLFQKTNQVTEFDESLLEKLEKMSETMFKANGLGLSSNQVGLDLNTFVMRGPDDKPIYFINPIIVKRSLLFANLKEGCLSSPGEYILIKDRPEWVQVKFQDENGKSHTRVFKGIFSVCVCHETEHLSGDTFLKHKSIPKKEKIRLAKKWGLG